MALAYGRWNLAPRIFFDISPNLGYALRVITKSAPLSKPSLLTVARAQVRVYDGPPAKRDHAKVAVEKKGEGK